MLSMFYHQISLTRDLKNCSPIWIDDVNHLNVPLGYWVSDTDHMTLNIKKLIPGVVLHFHYNGKDD